MTEADDITRQAARRLAAKYGKDLSIAVDQVLLGLKPGQVGKRHGAVPEQFGEIGDAANVAMAIAAYAALAWAIWHDTHNDKKPEPEAIQRELCLKLPAPNGLDTAARDEIIIVIIDEVMKK
jgi:hypothetical protein